MSLAVNQGSSIDITPYMGGGICLLAQNVCSGTMKILELYERNNPT